MSLPLGGIEHIAAVRTYTHRVGRFLLTSITLIAGMLVAMHLVIHYTTPVNEYWLGFIAVLLFGLVLLDLVALLSLIGAHCDLQEELVRKKS